MLAAAQQAAGGSAKLAAIKDFVESAEVVGKGRFQFEADAASERDRRDEIRRTTTSTPIGLSIRTRVSATCDVSRSCT